MILAFIAGFGAVIGAWQYGKYAERCRWLRAIRDETNITISGTEWGVTLLWPESLLMNIKKRDREFFEQFAQERQEVE